MLLEDVKILLEINDTSKDGLLNLYIRRSVTIIKNYLNNDNFTKEYIEQNYSDAIIELVIMTYRNKGKENIKSTSQGARSVTYTDGSTFAITESVKTLLPLPYVRMW